MHIFITNHGNRCFATGLVRQTHVLGTEYWEPLLKVVTLKWLYNRIVWSCLHKKFPGLAWNITANAIFKILYRSEQMLDTSVSKNSLINNFFFFTIFFICKEFICREISLNIYDKKTSEMSKIITVFYMYLLRVTRFYFPYHFSWVLEIKQEFESTWKATTSHLENRTRKKSAKPTILEKAKWG